jgi:hypothetical protein
VEAVTEGIETALRRIESRTAPGPLIVISALAEGADRLVAERVLARPGTRLIVPLPLRREEYLRDFESEASKQHFSALLERADEVTELPHQPSRGARYHAAGIYVLDHSDVLIAVWDGKPGRGASGTAEIVAEARRRGLPMAWVRAGNRKPATEQPTSLGDEQGKVTFENF